MGFGAKSHIHTSKILRLSMDLPIVIEIVDSEEKIQTLMPHLDEMVTGGMITMEKVQVIKYVAEPPK
jgi:PII-like signaling protein